MGRGNRSKQNAKLCEVVVPMLHRQAAWIGLICATTLLSDAIVRVPEADGPQGPLHERASRLRPSGGYRQLCSFQVTTIIYDATVAFCERFIDRRFTGDQTVQAARSGRQNIAEGSRASVTSSQTELRLVNVARASLDELLLDYEDFLRQRRLPLWDRLCAGSNGCADWKAVQCQSARSDETEVRDGPG